MKKLCGLACLFLLMVLVGGGLVAPLSSEAGTPTMSIGGTTFSVAAGGIGSRNTNCTFASPYNACFDFTFTNGMTTADGKWRVFDCAIAPNCGVGNNSKYSGRASILINDIASCSTCGGDMLSVGGIGLKPVTPSSTGVTGQLVVTHLFNDATNKEGNFYWAMVQRVIIDPPALENTSGDSVNFQASAWNQSGTSQLFSLGGFSKSASITSPIGNDGPATPGIDQLQAQFKGSCDTGGSKCNPMVKYVVNFTIKGDEWFIISKSLFGGGSTCGDTGNLPPCPILTNNLNTAANNKKNEDDAEARTVGAIDAQLCQGTCIVIQVDGTPAAKVEGTNLTVTATAPDISPQPVTIKLSKEESGVVGTGIETFSDLQCADPSLVRTFLFSDFGGLQLDTPNCTGGAICQAIYDDNNANTKVGFTITNVACKETPYLADLHVH